MLKLASSPMAPLWDFGDLAPPDTANPNLFTLPFKSTSTSSFSDYQGTSISPSFTSYDRLTLLGLASEIRDQIWQAIFDDITATAGGSDWVQRPATNYDGLSLTCHQIGNEIAFFWPRTIIQYRRIATFTQPTLSTRQDFRRLSLEIPISQKYQFFLAAAASFKLLAPVLQDLQIFFVGSDKFQVRLSLGACGIHRADVDISVIAKRLTIDGQNHSIRQPLFVALRSLVNLRSLVLSNHNYPILPKMVLEDKFRLRQLHLDTDARTTVHREHDLSAGGLNQLMIRPLQHGFPPVEILTISANASLNSSQLAGACTLQLRHLTWTVPDLSLQSPGGISVNWYRATASLFHVLRQNSKQLRTLRMCFHETIYEADTAAGTLIPAFRLSLEHLPLETLELHINSQSPWLGTEILQYLPNTLRRLYLSRELLDEIHLTREVDRRYMSCHSTSGSNSDSRFLRLLEGTTLNDFIQVGEEGPSRKDFISLGGGKLGFIGYEYEATKPFRFGGEIQSTTAEATKTWMLTLNGRLLDRERNEHLAGYEGAEHITPRQDPSRHYTLTAEKYSIASKYGPMWVDAPPSLKEVEAAKNEMKHSIITQDTHSYFGNEEAALDVFQREKCTHADDVAERLWPDEVFVQPGDHWQTDPGRGPKGGVGGVEGVERGGADCCTSKQANNSHSAWEVERTDHWVQYWTWYPRNQSCEEEAAKVEVI